MSYIKLNFINRSYDINNSTIALFQRNRAADLGETAVAWKVIKNCGHLNNHPFIYPLKFEVTAQDAFGNCTPKMPGTKGKAYAMIKDSSGNVLRNKKEAALSRYEVEVKNELLKGAISAKAFLDNKLVAQKKEVAPGQKAVFEFEPKLYIGIVSEIEEGDTVSAAILDTHLTALSIWGLTAADIVMTGGGPGPYAKAFNFRLENIQR